MRSYFRRKPVASQDFSLNITSMADIFTILLVFLLKSFSVGVSAVSPTAEMVLPEVQKSDPLIENVKVEISNTSVLIDGKEVMVLKDFQPDAGSLDADGSSKAVSAALKQQREKNTLKNTSRLMLMADQAAPYAIVKSILISASTNGFEEFKLVVVENL
jgi:biopolymer transport protein ExbD